MKHTPLSTTTYGTLSHLVPRDRISLYWWLRWNKTNRNHRRHDIYCMYLHLCIFPPLRLLCGLCYSCNSCVTHIYTLASLSRCVKSQSAVWFDVYKAAQQKTPRRMRRSCNSRSPFHQRSASTSTSSPPRLPPPPAPLGFYSECVCWFCVSACLAGLGPVCIPPSHVHFPGTCWLWQSVTVSVQSPLWAAATPDRQIDGTVWDSWQLGTITSRNTHLNDTPLSKKQPYHSKDMFFVFFWMILHISRLSSVTKCPTFRACSPLFFVSRPPHCWFPVLVNKGCAVSLLALTGLQTEPRHPGAVSEKTILTVPESKFVFILTETLTAALCSTPFAVSTESSVSVYFSCFS